MRRTSFVGALFVIAIGGVIGFAIQSSPKWLDLHATGLIIMLAGIADLVIRFAIGVSPLLGPQAADVAAVVEPLGEPVLDVFGNPIVTPPPPSVLQPPPFGTPVHFGSHASGQAGGDGTGTVTGGPTTMGAMPGGPEDTQDIPIVEGDGTEIIRPSDPMERYEARERLLHDQVVRQIGDYDQPSELTPVSPLTGRPVRRGWRGRRR